MGSLIGIKVFSRVVRVSDVMELGSRLPPGAGVMDNAWAGLGMDCEAGVDTIVW